MSDCWGLFPINGLLSMVIALLMLCTERRNFHDTWAKVSIGFVIWNIMTLNILGVFILAITFWIKIPGGLRD
jgi:hypothetical protein